MFQFDLRQDTQYSLRSWRYCKRTRNKVSAAKPRGEWGVGNKGISRGFAARFWRLRRQNFYSRAPTIPPATQATLNTPQCSLPLKIYYYNLSVSFCCFFKGGFAVFSLTVNLLARKTCRIELERFSVLNLMR